jgi:two-component system, cell cycle sensor histidine kinase and response regulator CckA
VNLDSSEGLALALFEESGDALFLFDPDTDQLLDANAKAQRLTGFSLRELLRMQMEQLFLFRGHGGLQRLRQATGKSGTFHSQEGYFLCTVQPETWIPINLTISRLHVKPKTLALFTARDIREQRQTLSQLKQTEGDLRRIIVSIPDCLWSGALNKVGHLDYRFISPVVAKIAGQPPEFFMEDAKRWLSVIHEKDRARWEEMIFMLRFAETTEKEYRIVWPDATVRWVREHIRATPGADGWPLRLDGIIRDITQQKQAEEKLQETEDRFRAFIGNSPALAFMKDEEGRYLYTNSSFLRAFQTTAASVLGKTDFDLFPEELARELRKNDAVALAATQTTEIIEHVPTGDGVVRSWRVFKFPVKVPDRRLVLGGIAIELTEQHPQQRAQMESQLPHNY